MCNKSKLTKHFFVLVNHPAPLQKPYVMGVVKQNYLTKELFESTRNSVFLQKKDVESLGYKAPSVLQAYLLPIEIPQDWFLH